MVFSRLESVCALEELTLSGKLQPWGPRPSGIVPDLYAGLVPSEKPGDPFSAPPCSFFGDAR